MGVLLLSGSALVGTTTMQVSNFIIMMRTRMREKKNSTYWSTPPILIFKNFHWHVMISWKRVAMIGDEICPFFS